MSVQQETVLQASTPQNNFNVSKCTRSQKAVFYFISSMRMEKANHLLALSSSTSVKCRMSKPVTEKVVNISLMKRTSLKLTKPVQKDLMKHIEDTVCLVTHLSQEITRCNPLFNPTGKLREQHDLCAPSNAAVSKTLATFQKQQSNSSKATFIENYTATMKKLFMKGWKYLDIPEKYPDVTKCIYVNTWKIPETDSVAEVFKYVSGAHSMKFKGQVNGNPICVLMDTCASCTAFVDRKFCKDEAIPLYPAPPIKLLFLETILEFQHRT
jgi:hypothetical protein